MAKHLNFYENIDEAQMRLLHTSVVYDGELYYILAITNHKKDGIFRVYMDKVNNPEGMAYQRFSLPLESYEGPSETGKQLDEWLDENPNSGVVRKMANSPLFNSFRPFPLGMVNKGNNLYYVRRTPVRPSTHQGLTQGMLMVNVVAEGKKGSLYSNHRINSTDFELSECVEGKYPDIKTVINEMNDPTVENQGVAFHREFGIVRGPLDSLYLAYKEDLIGILPQGNTSELLLGRKFKHCKEVVESLSIFYSIKVM